MTSRLSISEKTEKIFRFIQAREYLQPYCLAKISIALAVREKRKYEEDDFSSDNNGLELNRQTITGEYDELFKCLIELNEGRHISDDEYFPQYVKAYMERGAMLLEREYLYGKNIYTHLVSLEKGI